MQEGRFHFFEYHFYGVIVYFFYRLNQIGQAHVHRVGEFGRVGFIEFKVFVGDALEGKHHVVGVKVARGGEVVGGTEFHALAQMEGVGFAIVADVPFFGQCRMDVGFTAFKFNQAVVNRVGAGVKVGAGGVLGGVETGRAAFRAVNQIFAALCLGGGRLAAALFCRFVTAAAGGQT